MNSIQPYEPLTAQELEALRILGTYRTVQEAAVQSHIDKTAFARLLHRARLKFDVDRPSDALVAAWRAGLLELPVTARPPLAPEHQQMLDMLVKGLSYDQMSTELGLNPRMVYTRLTGLYKALDVSTRVPAIYRGITGGHVPLQP